MTSQLQTLLQVIQSISRLSVPKSPEDSRQELEERFPAENVDESGSSWRIACTHTLYAPATTRQIAEVESALEQELPQQLVNLLFLTNGAELFQIIDASTGYQYPRYHVLSSQEIIQTNQELYDVFETDPKNWTDFSPQ